MTGNAATVQVACPKCGAGYAVPLAKIGPKGRKLKCASCGHLWLVPRPAPETPAEAPAQETLDSPQVPSPPEDASPDSSSAATPSTDPIAHSAPVAEISAAPVVRLEELIQRPPSWQPYILGEQKWLTLAFTIALVGLASAVVALWQRLQPPAAAPTVPLFQAPATALPTPVAAPAGVVLHQVQAQTEIISNTRILTILGQVANTTGLPHALPVLQASLVDANNAVQDFQTVSLVTTTLPPQTGMNFAVSFTNPLGTSWRLNWVK